MCVCNANVCVVRCGFLCVLLLLGGFCEFVLAEGHMEPFLKNRSPFCSLSPKPWWPAQLTFVSSLLKQIQICLSSCFWLLWRASRDPSQSPAADGALRAGHEKWQGSPASLLPSPSGSLSSSRGIRKLDFALFPPAGTGAGVFRITFQFLWEELISLPVQVAGEASEEEGFFISSNAVTEHFLESSLNKYCIML